VRFKSASALEKRKAAMPKRALEQIAELWDVRCCLEAAAARLACGHVTRSRLNHLRGLCLQRQRAANQSDHRIVNLLSIEFHQYFVDLSFNRLIKAIFRERKLLERTLALDYGIHPYAEELERTEIGYRQLVEALALRDPHLMESLMIRHILTDRERRFAALEQRHSAKAHPDIPSGKRSHSGSHTTKG
jgi:DNA-binding FadR family transcriptional regulator